MLQDIIAPYITLLLVGENNVFQKYSEYLLRVAEEKLEMKKEYYSAKLNILKEAKQKDSFENKMLDMAAENNKILNNIHSKLNMILEKLENRQLLFIKYNILQTTTC